MELSNKKLLKLLLDHTHKGYSNMPIFKIKFKININETSFDFFILFFVNSLLNQF